MSLFSPTLSLSYTTGVGAEVLLLKADAKLLLIGAASLGEYELDPEALGFINSFHNLSFLSQGEADTNYVRAG